MLPTDRYSVLYVDDEPALLEVGKVFLRSGAITVEKMAANRKMHLLSGITRNDILNQLTILQGYLALIREQIADPVLLGYLDRQGKAIGFIQRQIAFTQDYQGLGIRGAGAADGV